MAAESTSMIYSFPKNKIKILLLENIDQTAVDRLREEEFHVDRLPNALGEEELVEKLRSENYHCIGIRSKTEITEKVLRASSRLMCVGCFCIGTNQCNLLAAEKLGIPIFNSPFCNTRSVAELIIAQIINLSRHLGDRNKEMHSGIWNKTSKNSREIRGKVIGIVGYGHIGTQLSVLAEALGMKVLFYDIVKKMALGNSVCMRDLDSLLSSADYVTLHVPETPDTTNMIKAEQLALMKKGSYLLNASRGRVVDLTALKDALLSKHLAGAYIDVFPSEPKENGPGFVTELMGLPNVLLTPHVGGSTEEAQLAIAEEVSQKFIDFINTGSTVTAVNFPEIGVPFTTGTHRILNIHRNVPGVLRQINSIIAEYNINISRQVLATTKSTGYLIIDVETEVSHTLKDQLRAMPDSIKTRILY